MFCHKCGQQASEGAVFCRNCGEKLRGEEPAEELFDVTLFFVEPVRKVQVIKVVREWTGLGLGEAKELVEKAPVLLRRSVTRKEAEFIKPILAKAGASLVFTDQSGNQVSITVPCKRCGAPLDEWSTTCRVCGNTVEIPPQYETKPADADASGTRASGADASGTGTSSAGTSSTSTAVVAIGAVLVLLVKVVGSLMAVAAVVAIVTAVTENGLPDEIRQLVEPGMEVRGAYLTQYSDEVTVGKAFDDFFANEKWSTYSSEGYSYVVFTGACEYLGERADVRVTFKITGEKFLVDTLDINGREQSKLMLYGLLEKIYEDY